MKENGLEPVIDSELDLTEANDAHNKNQGEIDLDFLEEFSLNSSTSCDYGYFQGGEFPYPLFTSKEKADQTKTNNPSSSSSKCSFITSWKHSIKLNLDFKIFKYLSSVEEPKVKVSPPSKPYYEYFINSLFSHSNLNKSWLRYLEGLSIFVLRRLDRFNSQFKLIQTFVKSD